MNDFSLDILRWGSTIASCGSILIALESLAARRLFDDSQVFSSKVLKESSANQFRCSWFWNQWLVRTFLVARLAAALLLLFLSIQSSISSHLVMIGCLWIVVAFTSILLRVRQHVGDDGADQMLLILSISLGFGLLIGTEQAVFAASVFIGAQAILAYSTAGIAKLLSPTWRRGTVAEIFRTRMYGTPAAARVLSASPFLNLLLSWSVILLECSFLLAAFVPIPILYCLLFCMFLFHVGASVVMGLNTFLWTFSATFPFIILINQHVLAWRVGS